MSTEKQIFILQSLKIILHCQFEEYIGEAYANLEIYLMNSGAMVDVQLFGFKKKYFNRKILNSKIEALFSKLCPNIVPTIEYSTVKYPEQCPKYYFLMFSEKYRKFKLPPFNMLTKLDALKLPSTVSGIHIRVRGKRGARKDFKSLIIGQVSKHSNKKGELRKYKGAIHSPMGVTGVVVTLMLK